MVVPGTITTIVSCELWGFHNIKECTSLFVSFCVKHLRQALTKAPQDRNVRCEFEKLWNSEWVPMLAEPPPHVPPKSIFSGNFCVETHHMAVHKALDRSPSTPDTTSNLVEPTRPRTGPSTEFAKALDEVWYRGPIMDPF